MSEVIKAVIYGILEGVTEWLPVSSTGHLLLAERLIPFTGVSSDFFGMFDVVIQMGAILAVAALFWKQLWPFALPEGERSGSFSDIGSFGLGHSPMTEGTFGDGSLKAGGPAGRGSAFRVRKDILSLWLKILTACVPAAVIGLLFDDVFERLFYNYKWIATALIVFGVAFLIIEERNKGHEPKVVSLSGMNYRTALLIGVFQLIAAIFPGTSRSGATIVGALLIGVSRTAAAEFTFFLAIPVMFGASLLKLVKFGFHFTSLELSLLIVGSATAFGVSLLILQFLLSFVKKHDFKVFGWYRIVLGIVVLICFGVLV